MHTNVITSPVDMKERAALGIRSGDTVRVWQKIEEKGKTRLQAFEGLVLAVKHGSEAGGTFTVRKVASGVGVEKIFPLYSPRIDKIEIVKRAKVRRAKLYFVRDKVARDLKRVLRNTKLMGVATKGAAELEEERKLAEEEEAKRQEEAQRAAEKQEAEEKNAKATETNDEPEETSAPESAAEEVVDDLTKIAGVDEAVVAALVKKDIATFAALADVTVDALRAALEEAGVAEHDPTTWPEQAEMARDGKWEELEKWQKELNTSNEA